MSDHPHPAIRMARDRIEGRAEELDAPLLTCERCGGEMRVRSVQPTEDPLKVDIRVKCPWDTGCGWWITYGTSPDRETYEAFAEYGHVDAVTTDTPESSVEERLQALGYKEM